MPKPPTGYRTAAFPLLKPTAPSPVPPSEREPSGRLAYRWAPGKAAGLSSSPQPTSSSGIRIPSIRGPTTFCG